MQVGQVWQLSHMTNMAGPSLQQGIANKMVHFNNQRCIQGGQDELIW
jgi:hypothetical protein